MFTLRTYKFCSRAAMPLDSHFGCECLPRWPSSETLTTMNPVGMTFRRRSHPLAPAAYFGWRRVTLALAAILSVTLFSFSGAAAQKAFDLRDGDRVVFLGD